MPYPNEHACRLRDPSGLNIVGSQNRQHDGKTYRIIFGIPKDGGKSIEQAYRYPKDTWTPEQARNHCKDHDGSFEVAETKKEEKMAKTVTLEEVEIFKAGTWNGHSYEDKHIQAIIDNFKELYESGALKPPLKLGHSKDQKLLQQDGYPAAGWITALKKMGQKIVATITDVPQKIADLIKNGAYKKVSCEIIWNGKWRDKKYDRVLEAVALLGGDIPAVESLKDVEALYEKEIPLFHEPEKAISYSYSLEREELEKQDEKESQKPDSEGKIKKKEVKKMTDEEIQQLKQEKEDAEKRAQEAEDKLKNAETERADMIRKQENSEIETFVDSLVEKGKVLPREHDNVISVMQSLDNEKKAHKYTIDDGKGKKTEEEVTARELYKRELEARPNMVKFEELSRASTEEREEEPQDGADEESAELDTKAKAYIKEHPETNYADALSIVSTGKEYRPIKKQANR